MEQELFSTQEAAAQLGIKPPAFRMKALRAGFEPAKVIQGKGKPQKFWTAKQIATIAGNARADVTNTEGTADTVAPDTAEVTNISTIEPAPVVITLNERANRIRALQADVQRGIFQIGFELIAAKEQVGHGNWSAWLKHEFNWTQRTANNFMRVAKRFGKLENVFQFQPATFQAMLTLTEGTEQEFIDAQAAAGKPVETQSARDVKKSVKAFKEARAMPKENAEEPAPDLSNVGEKFSLFGRETDAVTQNDRPVGSEPVTQDSAEQEETAADDVARFTVVTPKQLVALRELVTGTNDLRTLKKIHDSLLELAQEFGKVILLTEAKIGELTQKNKPYG